MSHKDRDFELNADDVLLIALVGVGRYRWASSAPAGSWTAAEAGSSTSCRCLPRTLRFHLPGLGLGGAIVQAAAIDHPGRIERLAPCCCRAQMVPDFAAMWHPLLATVRAQGIEPIVEPTAQRWFSEAFKAAHPDVLDAVRKMIRRTSVQGYLGCAGAFLGLALEDRIHLIKARTLYISGAEDQRGGPPALMAGLAARVPGARHASIPDAAHIANVQNPDGFNRTLREFLTEA